MISLTEQDITALRKYKKLIDHRKLQKLTSRYWDAGDEEELEILDAVKSILDRLEDDGK